MDKNCIVTQNAILVSTEEYRELVRAKAFLDVVVETAKVDRYGTINEVVKVVSGLVSPVVTVCAASSPETEGGAGA